MKIHYCEEDKALNEREFICFANQVCRVITMKKRQKQHFKKRST